MTDATGSGPDPLNTSGVHAAVNGSALLSPDREIIGKHLYALFPHSLVKDYPDCWIEIATASKATEWKPVTARHFSPFDLPKVINYVEKQNRRGVNIYVGPSLRQGKTGTSGRSTDANFLASQYSWADFDGAGDFERVSGILKANSLQNAMLVVTGRVPHTRAHPYFEIASKIVDGAQMRSVNAALKSLLGTDDVEDPCRLMRLAGTVSYPSEDKIARGYTAEMVTLHIRQNAASYTVHHLLGLAGVTADDPFTDFANRTKRGRSDNELIATLEVSRVKGKWHNSLRDAIAVMIGRDWSDLQIRLACAPYCERGADDPDLDELIDGARKKWDKPDEEQPVQGADDQGGAAPASDTLPPQSLADVHAVFNKWLGAEYDLDAATAVMAAAASERLPGDPLWLLIVAGSGGAKTETVQALAGAGAYITSTISSEGALLSATPVRQKTKKATGGLLRKIGDRGTLVIKDFTSILSADRNLRGTVLAALREIYDGRWERNVGSDGGQTLTWTGRIVVVAAVTTAWDAAHAVVASMGDRFALLRLRTNAEGRKAAGTGAVNNTGGEIAMRKELAGAVGGLIAHMKTEPYELNEDEVEKIVKVADLVTVARSAVERDFRGDIEFAHDPEAPTRFAKQLVQLMRGAIAIGVEPVEAMRLVQRCACDSIPPLRRDILLDLAEHPGSRVSDIRKRISQPRNTVRRGCECLHMLRVLTCEETEEDDRNGKKQTVWCYGLADEFDRETLQSMTTR
ncbi:hypothetical protein [Bradyrhizobium ottawaense]|uniref:hypothetical protein n=1 Tax=Bradyrhizobium ottawaense TaxID=931866 RepID=UPI001BAC60FB|nr:hypothetical protein [Bradyrhizobium ottawaense]MBR1290147.1 hypothetical protein [Bradyrhizobium ottawaense]